MPEAESPTALDALEREVERAREAIRPPPPDRCSEWAARHFRLAAESSAAAGRFDPRPYQRDLLDIFADESVRRVTVRKAARVGYTKSLLAAVAFMAASRRRNALLLQPTADDARRFAKDSVQPMLREVRPLADALRGDGRGGSTLGMAMLLGCTIEVRGGNTPNAYRRSQQDLVCYDELDAFPANVGGEGDPVALGDRRVADSPFGKSIRGSTPTTAGRSLLERCEAAAELLLRFCVPCPRCGLRQPLAWGGEGEPAGLTWPAGSPGEAAHACRGCGARWRFGELGALLEAGRWEADGGRHVEAGALRSARGEPLPWPPDVALHLWAAYALPWADIARGRLAAGDDPDLLRAWTNTVLAEHWREEESAAEPEPLLARREPYRRPPAGVLAATFGADVQADRIECELAGWGAGEECWSLGYLSVPGDPASRAPWDELLRFVRQELRTEDGRRLVARCGIVDSGYLPDEVYAFSRRAGLRFAIPGKGSSVANHPVATLPRRVHRERRVFIAAVGSAAAKDVLFARLPLEGAGPGRCHWPDSEQYDEEYFRQLTGEEKRPARRRGRTAMAYQQSHPRVEALDCRVYALAAARIAQARGWMSLDAPAPAGEPPPPPPGRERRRGGWTRPKR